MLAQRVAWIGGIGVIFAAASMESETTQLAPANAMQIALPAQLK
jgi:hypothetical protein